MSKWIRFMMVTACLTGISGMPHAAVAAQPVCRSMTFPVGLTPDQPRKYRIYAKLCQPRHGKATAVHVALHGGMYNHIYWDWPYKPELYSYVRAMTAAGYAVLAVDRIGTGKSSRPPSEEVDFPANAHAIHQIVDNLRSGTMGGIRFDRIILVGHSMGSDVSSIVANTYGGVDGVILTGFSHGIVKALSSYADQPMSWAMPANQDPKFKALNLDDGYITSKPGMRGPLFYDPRFTDPKVYEVEEATKDTFTMAEIRTMPVGLATQDIRVPVLMVNGADDLLGCGPEYKTWCMNSAALAANEAPHFSPKACLQTLVLPQTMHDLNATAVGPLWFAYAAAWSDTFVGRNRPATPCVR